MSTSKAYRYIAPFHEALGHVYSGGAIRRCKRDQASMIQPGQRVLYAGGGAGEGARAAAERGARVTLVDHSSEMAWKAHAALAGYDGAEIYCEDIREHWLPEHYDVVCANFFLGEFGERDVLVVLEHLVKQLRVGGTLSIVDFALGGSRWQRGLQHAYHALAIATYAVIADSPVHGLYDFEALVERAGLTLEAQRRYRVYRGPELFQLLSARRDRS